jgi:hypothetical protein
VQAGHAANNIWEGAQGVVTKVQDGQAIQGTQISTEACELVEAEVQEPAANYTMQACSGSSSSRFSRKCERS